MLFITRNLQAFLEVARHGTVQAAAVALGLTQTAVTQRILALEEEVSVTLFLRSRKGMRLTREGMLLQQSCAELKNLQAQTLSSIRGKSAESTTRLRMSATSTAVRTKIIPVCRRLRKDYPNLLFSIDVDDRRSSIDKLRDGRVDIAIVPRHDVGPDLDSKVLRPLQYLMVGPAEWKGRTLEDIVEKETIVDYDENDNDTLERLRELGLYHLVKRERNFINDPYLATRMLMAGCGYSVLLREYVAPWIRRGKLIQLGEPLEMKFCFAMAWYRRAQLPDYFAAFVNAVQ